MYFIHPLVLVGVSLAIAGWKAPSIAKFPVAVALSLPGCWAAAWLLRLVPVVRRVL